MGISGLSDGTIFIDATSTDAANNIGIISPIEGDNIINASEVTDVDILGTGTIGGTVTITLSGPNGNTLQQTTIVDGSGIWSTAFDITSLAEGPVLVSATIS